MKCAVHAEVDAVRYCRNCGKALCEQCKREVRGVVYCEECLAAAVLAPPSQPASAAAQVSPGVPSPGLAFALGFIPGVGAIYNGQYLKGFIHIAIIGGIITLLSQGTAPGAEPILGLGLAAFWVYMVVDSYRTAKAKCAGMPVADEWALGSGTTGARFPVGPMILIGLGVLFLLNTMGVFEHLFRFYFWPIALILLGVLLLIRRMSPGGQ